MKSRCIALLLLAALVAGYGCKNKNSDRSQVGREPASAEAKAYFNAVAKGMKIIPVEDISEAMVGKQCTIMAATPKDVSPPPPPLGMVRAMGPSSVYRGKLVQAGPESVTVAAPYPTSGKSKQIEVPTLDIKQFALAD